MKAADAALVLAHGMMETWKESSNEWRKENMDQRAQYITIDKANALISVEASLRGALEGRVRVLEDSSKMEGGGHSALSTAWIVVAFTISSIISIVSIYFRKR